MSSTVNPTHAHRPPHVPRLLRQARPQGGRRARRWCPHNDPTLLFTNAGMNQFKDFFTGKAKPPFAARHQLAEVRARRRQAQRPGERRPHRAPPHLLRDAGQLLVRRLLQARRDRLRLRAADQGLRASTRRGSSTRCTSPTTRRARSGRRSPASATTASSRSATRTTSGRWARPAPAARAARSTSCRATTSPAPRRRPGGSCQGAACDCDRWVEIWNLVFMQFEQVAPGRSPPAAQAVGRHRHGPRAAVRGAAGRALELRDRSAAPADRRTPRSCRARRSSPTDYAGTSVSLRAIADHARAAAFLIADGVFPDKTGREYVLRRIMRRGVYHGWLLGIKEPFLHAIAGDVIDEDGRRLSRAGASARA